MLQPGILGSDKPFPNGKLLHDKNHLPARRQWLTPVILATQEAEIRRIVVQSQPGQIVCETLHQNNPYKTQRLKQ
jgi:hypothetical protein